MYLYLYIKDQRQSLRYIIISTLKFKQEESQEIHPDINKSAH